MAKAGNTPKFETFDQPQGLLKETLLLLKKDERAQREISQQSDLPLVWIQSLSQGKIKNPSVNRIQVLYEFLSNRKLLETV